MKKLKIFQISLVTIFLLFIIFLIKAQDYSKEYTIDEVSIKEKYSKDNKSYYFTFTYKNQTLNFLSEEKYKHHRTLIKEIKVIEDDNNFCLIPQSEYLTFIPLCYDDNKEVHYSLVNNNLKKELDPNLFPKTKKDQTYNDIEIYNREFTYLLWNYDGFYYINDKETKKIDILSKELYTINLVGYTNDYLVLADYDSNYTFNRFYTIEFKNGNLKKYELDRSIYFDSYFIGHEKNKIYIVDNKESVMYEFNAKNGKLEKIKSKILVNNEWKKVKIKTLINNKQEFEYASNFNYTLEDNNLYLNYKDKDNKTLISTNVTSIVRINNKDVFYLKEDKLYHFNITTGEELLLRYFEWNFNYANMIYIN